MDYWVLSVHKPPTHAHRGEATLLKEAATPSPRIESVWLAILAKGRYLSVMSAPDLQPLVDRLLIRSALSGEERQALLDLPARSMQLPGNHNLVALGQQTESSFLIASGVLGRFSQMNDGTRQIVALHIPGDMADLCSVALPKTSWAFHVLVPSKVVQISHADLNMLAAKFPKIAMAFWRDCVADMAIMSEWIVSIARRPAEARLAHLLCELLCRYKQAGMLAEDGSYTFPLTQLQIADVLGITPIHLNRMIRVLRERGLASVSRSAITIDDQAGLFCLAEFDPAYLHFNEIDAIPSRRTSRQAVR